MRVGIPREVFIGSMKNIKEDLIKRQGKRFTCHMIANEIIKGRENAEKLINWPYKLDTLIIPEHILEAKFRYAQYQPKSP